MSFISILIPLLGLLMTYYIGMIAYDIYIDKLKSASTVVNTEEEIDITSELEGFAPIQVNKKEEQTSDPVATCCGMEIEKLRTLMEKAAYGKSFAGLDNISHKCLSAVG